MLAAFAGRQSAVLALKLPLRDPRRVGLGWWAAVYAALVLAAGLSLAIAGSPRALAALGIVAGAILALTMVLDHRRMAFSAVAEAAGFTGLSLVAPAAECVAAGAFTGRSAAVGALLAAYLIGSMLHVRFLLRAPRAFDTLAGRLRAGGASLAFLFCVVGLADWAAASGYVPLLAPLAFLPALTKALRVVLIGHGARPVVVRAVGWREAVHLLLFVALVVAAYRLS